MIKIIIKAFLLFILFVIIFVSGYQFHKMFFPCPELICNHFDLESLSKAADAIDQRITNLQELIIPLMRI